MHPHVVIICIGTLLSKLDLLVWISVVLVAPQYADEHNDGRHNAPYRVVEEHVVVPLAELVAKEDGVAE